MTYDDLIQVWMDYCRRVIPNEWTVTRAEEVVGKDAPRPNGPYLTVKIISGPRHITLDDEMRAGSGKKFNLVGQRAYTISIKAFRSGHNDILNEISTCLDIPGNYDFLREKACIAITNRGNVLDISGQLETGFEGRSSLDIIFNSSMIKKTDIGTIEGVQIDGQLKDENEKIINTSQEITKG